MQKEPLVSVMQVACISNRNDATHLFCESLVCPILLSLFVQCNGVTGSNGDWPNSNDLPPHPYIPPLIGIARMALIFDCFKQADNEIAGTWSSSPTAMRRENCSRHQDLGSSGWRDSGELMPLFCRRCRPNKVAQQATAFHISLRRRERRPAWPALLYYPINSTHSALESGLYALKFVHSLNWQCLNLCDQLIKFLPCFCGEGEPACAKEHRMWKRATAQRRGSTCRIILTGGVGLKLRVAGMPYRTVQQYRGMKSSF